MFKLPRLLAPLALLSLTFAHAAPQTSTPAAPSASTASSAASIGPADAWQMPSDFIREAHLACDNAPGDLPDFAGCFIDQMSKSGAPPQAVQFTRMYQQLSGGEVAILTSFKKVGPVDMAQVAYPLRANSNTGVLLVNGDPPLLDVNDLKKLDRTAMEQDWTFQAIQKQYPKSDLWPFTPDQTTWPAVNRLPDGGVSFIVGYPMLDGCHACRHVGLERFNWNFDASGKFTGTTYLISPPPPRHRVPTPDSASPSAPTAAPNSSSTPEQPHP